MLRLKRVELQGFKSFCDRTEMRFHGTGMAAIVGPNGCGKSNLSDAISWVLGEQSAKSLRGTRMEDVIFAGTRDRKPLGMAAVTLTLVDPDGSYAGLLPAEKSERRTKAEAEGDEEAKPAESDRKTLQNGEIATHGEPLQVAVNGAAVHGHRNGHENGYGPVKRNGQPGKPHEITVTRRLYRSGESEYLINGRHVRLRDIQEVFMGTGLGPESYAIIEQGRIGQILSNKPADRRAVIEEAAGVTKFKTKKRLAEAKLESARQNLSRVFDILEEVGRQVNSLKRQAAKARRYEELRTEMLGYLKQTVAGRFQGLEREASKLALELKEASAEVQGIAEQVAVKESEQKALQEQCFQTEAQLTEARQKLADLKLDAERTRGRLENQAAQIGNIDARLQQAEAESQHLESRQGIAKADLESHVAALAEIDAAAEALRQRLAAKNSERDEVQNGLRQREQAMEAARQSVLRLLGEASTLKNQLAQVEEYLAAIERDTQRARKEEETAVADMARLEELKKELSAKLQSRQLQLESLADQRKRGEEMLAERRSAAAEARRRLEEARGELSRTKARKDSLEEILSHRAYTTESVKRLFTAIEHGQVNGFKPYGVLADFVEVTDAAFEKACEEFLHEELEYVVVSNWEEAEQGVALMRSDVDGRATFLVHPESAGTPQGAPRLEAEGVVARLADVMRLTNGFQQAPADLIPRLERCYIAADKQAAQRLAVRYPDLFFLLPDGVSYHGHAVSGGKKTGGGPLALKRELRELSQVVAGRQRAVDEITAALEALEREIAMLSEDLEELRQRQQAEEKDKLALDHDQRKMAEELARAASRLSISRMELERLQREDGRSREQREKNQVLVAEREQSRFEQEMALAAARAELEALQAQAHRIAEEHAALRAELAGLEERRRGEANARIRLEAQLREIETRREDLGREVERMGVERARLLADNIELDQRSAQLALEIENASTAVNELSGHETEQRAALVALEESLKELRGDVQVAQEKRGQVELELVRRQGDLRYLDETARKELGEAAQTIAAAFETVPEGDALAEIEQKCQDVRARIEAMGPVNPQALEEFEEAQKRYDFLNAQRQDLLDSIRDTEKAIHDIDQESRKRFAEAFEAINTNFRETFRTLFGGGTGEMRLTDETNLAECGIDIVASPPGKKLQNVLLLSGGEKSLTAMALLMAIFRYQPSPFCVLDEVDAALDEANTMRLTRLLQDISMQTQVIMITHARRTMESASTLYGVTMQEPGVSTLVSVKFEPAPASTTPVAVGATA